MDTPEVRAQVRESLRGFIARMDVDLVGEYYAIPSKGTNDHLEVLITGTNYYMIGGTAHRLPKL